MGDTRQIDFDAAVVVGNIGGLELAVVLAATVHGQNACVSSSVAQMLDRQVVSVVMTSTPLR